MFQQGRGVDFHLVRAQGRIVPQPLEIRQIRLRGRSVQVGHPVQHDLESRQAQTTHRVPHILHRVPAFVQRQDAIIKGLRPHLDFGHALLAQRDDLLGRDPIGARFDHQADVAMRGGFVAAQSFVQRGGFALV